MDEQTATEALENFMAIWNTYTLEVRQKRRWFFFVVGFVFTVYLSFVKLFTEKWIRNQAELRCIMGRTHIHTRLKLNPSLRKKIVFVRLKRFFVCDCTLSVVLVGKTFQYLWLLCVCLFVCLCVCVRPPPDIDFFGHITNLL